jgi:Uma2 family endonuclease
MKLQHHRKHMSAIQLNLKPIIPHFTHEQFYELCMANQDIAMERTVTGELIIMPSVGGERGEREADLITDLVIWNRQTQRGKVFSSSTVFKLPNGGDRSPDAAWVQLERWNALTPKQRKKFPPLCPDFVIELRSDSDRFNPLQDKMQEYLTSGLQLGWLINPQRQTVEIYRPDQAVEVLTLPATLSGESVLPGLSMTLD